MAKKVSIKDIATKVGVSTALVSYVMNGLEKEKRVGKEIVEKIKKAAEELNYQPNQIARSLRTGSTNTLGLIVADISNSFFGHLARIIEDEASQLNYAVIIGSSDENWRKSNALAETLLNRQVDGFILIPSEGDEELVQSFLDKEIPFILIDRNFANIDCNYVMLDNFRATYQATSHLIENGYSRIKLVAYRSSLNHMKDRVEGYLQAMSAFGLSTSIELIEPKASDHSVPMDEIVGLFDSEAILFATNTLTIAGLYAIQRKKLKIPEQLAIVGFDRTEVYDFFVPPITYIEQPMAEIGQLAVQNLVKLIAGSKEAVHLRLSPQFIERQSSQKKKTKTFL